MKRLITSMLVALYFKPLGNLSLCLEGTVWDDVLQGFVFP